MVGLESLSPLLPVAAPIFAANETAPLAASVRNLLRSAGRTPEEAIARLLAELGTQLGARCVRVCVPLPGPPAHAQTLAVWPALGGVAKPSEDSAIERVWSTGEARSWHREPDTFGDSAKSGEPAEPGDFLGQRIDSTTGHPLALLLVLLGPAEAIRPLAELLVPLYALRLVRELERQPREADTLTTEPQRASSSAICAAQIAQLNDVFEHTEESVVFLRRATGNDFVVERVNSRFCASVRLPAVALVGRSLGTLHPPELASRMLADCHECLRTRSPKISVQHVALRSGARVYRTRLIPVREAHGSTDRLILLATEITDLHQQENLLAETEAITRVGGWDYDTATQRLVWSAGTFRIFDQDPGTYRPSLESVIAMHSPGHAPAVRIAFEHAMATGADFDFTAQAILPSGRTVTLHTLGQAETVDGRVVRLYGAVRDITADEEADQLRLRLETQLRRAQKMEAVGTLAGGIAHDFNNILAGIMGNVQLASFDLPEVSPSQRFLDQAYQGCTRARDLVRRILTFSQQTEHPRSISALRPLIEEAIDLLRASIPANVAIQPHFTEEQLHALVDPGQIHQIVLNLGLNAAHAMRTNGGVLTIELTPVTDAEPWTPRHPQVRPDHRIRLTVRDTGCGIPSDQIERIFEPFFTTKDIGEGTGLGLAMVHGILETHDGAIVVESALGVGSAFHLFFPGQIRRHEDSISSPGLTDHEPATGSGQPLLVVDDEVGITKVVVPLLAHLGYSARVFTDPHRALEAFAAAPESFAALLTDLTMPSIDGLTLSKTIRALRTDIPIILMTGHIRLADVSVMRSCGIAHYLTKPFSIHTLAAKLREALPSPAPVDSSSSSSPATHPA